MAVDDRSDPSGRGQAGVPAEPGAGVRSVQLRQDDLVWQDLDGRIVVLDLRASHYFSLNGSGALLWRRLAAGASAEDLANELVEAYGIDRGRATSDVRTFLDDLNDRHLLRS